MIRLFPFLLLLAGCTTAPETHSPQATLPEPINWNREIIYHVMPRSFYDSNGDRHGDLNGFVQKLDYLKALGVTTILFTPLYESGFYHNYFPTDYEKIDPEYGTMEDYIRFVKAVHARGLKFLMDMETQYAQSGHPWFDESYRNPSSPYSDFIYYSDSLNEFPEQIFMPARSPLHQFTAWPGDKHHIVLLDLNHARVKDWMKDFYLFWVDPNQDGNFDDGVDGFRIDHIMDDLDHKGIMTNLYTDLWKPIFDACKSLNPNVFILGEQSDWNEYGDEMVRASGADAAFSFPIRFALAGEEGTHDMYKTGEVASLKLDPSRVHQAVIETQKRFVHATYSVNFLENHDTDRWASLVNEHAGQQRVAAVMNLLLPGVPSIYYGQELGLIGQKQEWGSDANHIPVREGFPWTSDLNGAGHALWYRDTGEWWDRSFWNTEKIQALALTTQQSDEGSLWRLYQKLIRIRQENPSIQIGAYRAIQEDQPALMAFERTSDGSTSQVIVNITDTPVKLMLDDPYDTLLLEKGTLTNQELRLEGYGIWIAKSNG